MMAKSDKITEQQSVKEGPTPAIFRQRGVFNSISQLFHLNNSHYWHRKDIGVYYV